VICDQQGEIQKANPAFLEMVRLPHEGLVRGESLARWLGRGVVDLDVLMSGMKQARRLRHYQTTLSSEFSSAVEVDISAAFLDEQAKSLGLTIRSTPSHVTLNGTIIRARWQRIAQGFST
jgi:hypothetical protein